MVEVGERLRARLTSPFLLLFGLYLVIGLWFVTPRVTADGIVYFSESRSIVLDGSLDLASEYSYDADVYSPLSDAGPRAVLPRDIDGGFGHYANVGIVALFGPFILLAHALAALGNSLGAPISMDGFDRVYILAVAFGTNALVAAGLGLLAVYLRRYVGTAIAVAAAAAVWLGSSLFFWSAFRPAHAHAPAVFVEAAFLVLFLTRGRDIRHRVAWFALGLLGGLLLTVRPIAGLYVMLPAGWLVAKSVIPAWRAWVYGEDAFAGRVRAAGRQAGPAIVAGLLFLSGSIVGRLPQFAFAHDTTLTGSSFYLDTGYLGSGLEGDPVRGLLSLLLDPAQGQLWWVPVVPLSLIGIAAFWRRDRLMAISAYVVVGLVWGFVALLGAPQRFGGLGIPSRHLVEATPAYVIGAAGLLVGAGDVARALARRAARWSAGIGAAELSIGRWGRAGTFVAGVGVLGLVAWGWATQVAGAVVDASGLLPWDRVGATGLLGNFVTGSALLVLLGIVVLGITALLAGFHPGPSPSDATAPGARMARRWRRMAPALISTVPWVVLVVLVGATVAPWFAQPSIGTGDDRQMIRTWDGGPVRPAGWVNSVTYGRSPEGNQVIVPPPAVPPVASSELGTITRGTFVPVGVGRTVTFVPDPDWSAFAGVTLWFGPTFDTAAAVDVALRFAEEQGPPSVVRRLGASDLALGAVDVRLPAWLDSGRGRALVVSVLPVSGHPAPDVSIHGDGSLAYRAFGVPARRLPVLTTPYGPLLGAEAAVVDLPEATVLRVQRGGSLQMRFGPWAPEALLRWSEAAGGWRLPGRTVQPGTWFDGTVSTGATAQFLVRLEAPYPITAATANVIFVAYEDAPADRVRIDASANGLDWSTLVENGPSTPGQLARISVVYRPAATTTRVWFRLVLVSPASSTGITGGWFDLGLRGATMLDAGARSDAIVIPAAAQGSPTAPFRAEVADNLGRIDLALYAAGDLADRAFGSLDAGSTLALAALLLFVAVAAVSVRRRDARWFAVGLVLVAACFAAAGVVALPRTVVLPHTVRFSDGSGDGVRISPQQVIADRDGAVYVSPPIPAREGLIVGKIDPASAAGRPPSEAEVRFVALDGSTGPWLAARSRLVTLQEGAIEVRLTFRAGESLDRLSIGLEPLRSH